MLYNSHKEIPLKYRRIILEESLQKRVSNVPLRLCNEIIENCLEEERENETLKHYQIQYMKGGVANQIDTVGRQQCLVMLDRILEYGENKDPDIMIVVKQAKRMIAAYAKCEWLDIPAKDKLVIKSRGVAA